MTTIIKMPEVQQLKLANDLFSLLHSRAKKVICCNGRCDIKLGQLAFLSTDPVDPDTWKWDTFTRAYDDKFQGQIYMIQFVKVLRVSYTLAGDVTAQEAQEDGFEGTVDLIRGMHCSYPDFDAYTEVTFIRFLAQ